MVFLRRWILIGLLLWLGGGPAFGASREERIYRAAALAFQDKFYALAEAQLTEFLQTYRKSTNAPMAVLLLAQSDYFLKHYPAAISRLTDAANLARAQAAGLADSYLYWRGEAQFAQGDLAGAAQTLALVADQYPNSPFALRAVVEAATLFETLGQREQMDGLLGNPSGLFQRAAQNNPTNEQVVNGRLLQAESALVQTNFTSAIQILGLLDPTTCSPDQRWKLAHLLSRADLGRNDLDGALAAATNMVWIARAAVAAQGDAWVTNLAESVACNASVLEQQDRLAEASALWQTNILETVPVESQRLAILELARLAAMQNANRDAEAYLQNYRDKFPDSPAAAVALLALGELHLKDFVAQPAATHELEQFLTEVTNGPLVGKASLDHGWCNWLQGKLAGDQGDTNSAAQKISASLADFQNAVAQLPPPGDDLAVARFKTGDAQFALSNFSGAETNYQAVLAICAGRPEMSASTNSIACRALFQLLRTCLALHDAPGVEAAMSRLVATYFDSAPADSSRLLAGEGFSDFDSTARARQVFEQFERERTNSPLLPQVAFAAARTYEREQDWLAAVTNYQKWLNTYPQTNELWPQVEYARDWAVSRTGDEAGAFQMFTNFVVEHPTNALTPLVYWWLADHYFQLGDKGDAEYNYQWIFQYFPTHFLARPAQLMAARAVMGRSPDQAIKLYLDPLVGDTNCPPNLQTRALFAYCEALRNSVGTNNINLQRATNILGHICANYPTNEAGALAWDEIGDCDLQLGALDAATNAYTQAENSSGAPPALVCQAKVQLGETLEKKSEADGLADADRKALRNQALNEYLTVVYVDSEEFWVKEAAWKALLLFGSNEVANGDQLKLFFDRVEKLFPQLKEALDKKRAALKI
jgi:TolA-binding protein